MGGEGDVSILRLLGFMLYGEIKKKSNRQSQYETSLVIFNKTLKSDSHPPKKKFYLLPWKPFKSDKKCF